MEKETRLPRGTLTRTRLPSMRHRVLCIRARRVSLSTRCTHASGNGGKLAYDAIWKEAEEERCNSVHSEAFGREVCSACTLHSRAVHNSYCPSTRRTRAAHTTSSASPSSLLLPRSMDLIDRGRTPYVPPLNLVLSIRARGAHTNYAHADVCLR